MLEMFLIAIIIFFLCSWINSRDFAAARLQQEKQARHERWEITLADEDVI